MPWSSELIDDLLNDSNFKMSISILTQENRIRGKSAIYKPSDSHLDSTKDAIGLYQPLQSQSGSTRRAEDPSNNLKFESQDFLDAGQKDPRAKIAASEFGPHGGSMISVIAIGQSNTGSRFMESEYHNFGVKETSEREFITDYPQSRILINRIDDLI